MFLLVMKRVFCTKSPQDKFFLFLSNKTGSYSFLLITLKIEFLCIMI